MTIHLRTVTDERGDAIEHAWYCSRACYLASFDPSERVVNATENGNEERYPIEGGWIELGGAYPGGAEHDDADYCATCGDPVGNPLTDVGAENVAEYVRDVESGSHPWRVGPEHVARAAELRREYDFLFEHERIRGGERR